MKVVGYISSYRIQEIDRSLEVKIQKEKIEDFCRKHAFELVKIYEEPLESRADYKPELVKLINEASKNNFEKVVVLKLDRFGQDSSVKTWVTGELKKHNIEIYSLIESKMVKARLPEPKIQSKAEVILNKVRDIPSLPEIVIKVMELVQDPKSSAAQLGKVISHDPGLTSRVLRLVNSAYYGFPKQISSIQHAIMILGFTTMRGLILSSSIFKIFTPKSGSVINLDYKRFWKHSLITAIASKNINQFLQFQEDDDLFSAAILHDIGKIILDQYDHESYSKVLMEAPNPVYTPKVLEAEEKYCEIVHPEIGFEVAEGWNLPDSLADVIRYHHNPLESVENIRLTSVVYLGNIFSHIMLNVEKFDIALFDEKILDYLGLNEDDLFEINTNVIEAVENIGDLESFFR